MDVHPPKYSKIGFDTSPFLYLHSDLFDRKSCHPQNRERFTNLCQICVRTILQGETLQTSQQITLDGAPSIGINEPLSVSSRTKQTLKRLNFELENPGYEGL